MADNSHSFKVNAGQNSASTDTGAFYIAGPLELGRGQGNVDVVEEVEVHERSGEHAVLKYLLL